MNEEQFLEDTAKGLAGNGIDLPALISKGFDPRKPFTEEVFAPIAEKYGFHPDSIPMTRLLLNVAVSLSSLEAKWAATDLPKVRKKLSAVEKHSRALQQALRDLDDEDLYVANQASMGMEYAAKSSVLGIIGEDPLEPSPTMTWNGSQSALRRPNEKPYGLDELSTTLEALDQAINLSLRVARKGKTGRREDATLEALLGTALQVYENFTGKRFSLLWNEHNAPESEAARFCVALVNVFNKATIPSKIVSTSIAVRKNHIKISDLEELPDFFSHYSRSSR